MVRYIASPEIKIGCPDKIKFGVVKKIAKDWRAQFADQKITGIDGIRIDFKRAMMIIRASQNGPYLTARFAARDKNLYQKVKKYVRAELKKYPEIDWKEGVNLSSLR